MALEGECSNARSWKELKRVCGFCHHGVKLEQAREEDSVSCSRCAEQVIGGMYRCTWQTVGKACAFYAHEKCFKFPKSLEKSRVHPEHELRFKEVPQSGEFKCSACSRKLFQGQIYYSCTKCEFIVEYKCFLLSEEMASGGIRLQGLVHEHPLDFYYVNEKGEACIKKGKKERNQRYYFGEFVRNSNVKSQSCRVCRLRPSEQVYCCAPCKFWIHKSCLLDLPQELHEHPFHPQHLLTRHRYPPFPGGEFKCGACGRRHSEGNTFCCDDCGFCLDIQCAWHQDLDSKSGLLCPGNHHLTFFKDTGVLFPCHACNGPIYATSVYRCVSCDFNIHKSCIKFPLSVKNQAHPHQLQFCNSTTCAVLTTNKKTRLQLHNCSACAKKIDTDAGCYLCPLTRCNYALHINCVAIQDSKGKVMAEMTEEVEAQGVKDHEANENVKELIEKVRETRMELAAYTRLLKHVKSFQENGK